MALSFRPDTAPLLVLVVRHRAWGMGHRGNKNSKPAAEMKIKENAVAHDHSEQGGWGLE
jgi:hypothetical protein